MVESTANNVPTTSSSKQQQDSEYESKFISKDKHLREYFSIAPMVDVTDTYFCYLMRLMSKHAILYTEMINEHAVLQQQENSFARYRLLDFSKVQHPLVF